MVRKTVSICSVLVWLGLHLCVGQSAPSLAGEWNGTLDTGATKLRLVLKVSKGAEGKLSATLDSVDQNAKGIPVSSVEQAGNSVKLGLASIGASYQGKMNAAGSEIAGEWKQGGGSLPLVFSRAGHNSGENKK